MRCPLCAVVVENYRSHLLNVHGEEGFRKAILMDKERGVSDVEIGRRYGISFNTLEQILTEAYGANIHVPRTPKRIQRWFPDGFQEETTTVWSFKQRGNWATHDGRYRGNWSPYIPRNVILKYSEPGDVVLDYFVGGGTTAVEAKLLGRQCIARDINPGAIAITQQNLKFPPPYFLQGIMPAYEPEVNVGDARDLSGIPSGGVDLVCAHPPYAGIIKYSTGIPGDLSALPIRDFLEEMKKVAQESFRVLKPGGKCAILVGDVRKLKHVVPIGFMTIRVFLDTGFTLRELVIKRQYNCRTTGFWYTRSIQHNFLLLAHEYLPIFEKPYSQETTRSLVLRDSPLTYQTVHGTASRGEQEQLETTSVWIFPEERLESEVRRNLLYRFAGTAGTFAEVHFAQEGGPEGKDLQLVYIHWLSNPTGDSFSRYRRTIRRIAGRSAGALRPKGFLVLEVQDFRTKEGLVPAGLLVWEEMSAQREFALKEIIIVAPKRTSADVPGSLQIVHRYLFVYSRK